MAPQSTERQRFLNEQLESLQKALTKQEAPFKPKHARRIILGTHQDKNCAVFWTNVTPMQIEKNPILTWKFCHLLHLLIRDGHESVLAESHEQIRRIAMLGDVWKHQHSSPHGANNEQYCKMLCARLEFHKKHPQVLGTLCLVPPSILHTMPYEYGLFEIVIDMLDQADSLLLLHRSVFDFLHWPARDAHTASIPGQTAEMVLAPLKLVILDISKLYDLLVKGLFNLHALHASDVLDGLRDRFHTIFDQTKKFYEEAQKLDYFQYLITIPNLPEKPPNFLLASDIDKYQSPQAIEVEAGAEDDQPVPEIETELKREEALNAGALQSPTNPHYQRVEDPPPPAPPPRMKPAVPPSKPLPPPKPLPRTSFEKPKQGNLHADLVARAEKAEKALEEMTARYKDLEIKYQKALNLLVTRERAETSTSLMTMHTVREESLSVVYELPPLDD